MNKDQLKSYLESQNLYGIEVSAKKNESQKIDTSIEILLKKMIKNEKNK